MRLHYKLSQHYYYRISLETTRFVDSQTSNGHTAQCSILNSFVFSHQSYFMIPVWPVCRADTPPICWLVVSLARSDPPLTCTLHFPDKLGILVPCLLHQVDRPAFFFCSLSSWCCHIDLALFTKIDRTHEPLLGVSCLCDQVEVMLISTLHIDRTDPCRLLKFGWSCWSCI